MQELEKIKGILNKAYKGKRSALAFSNLMYEFKKLPSDLVGREAKITGKIGDMDVNLTLKFEPETIESVMMLFKYLAKRYEEEKKAYKRR